MDRELDQKALILDDDERTRRMLTLLIQDLGVSASGVSSFTDFKTALNPGTGLVVLDLSMPDVDGVEVIRHLALIGFRGRLIIVSGAKQRLIDAAELLARRSGLSVAGTLRKPCSPLQFQRTVQPLLEPCITPTPRPRRLPEAEVEYLLESGRLATFYQPKLSLKSGRIVGAEALVRCLHPTLGTIGPSAFLNAVSSTQLEERVNHTVIERVFQDVASWQATGLCMPVAINLSARSLSDLKLPDRIMACARRHGVNLADHCFEITETTFSDEMVHALDVLTRLRLKGVSLSIDDFGTGYSTEDRLRELPFTELKIDRSLVTALDVESGAREKIGRCIDLARRLDLSIVAEGVETPRQMETLQRMGVDTVQGYLVARPMPRGHIPGWLETFDSDGSIGVA